MGATSPRDAGSLARRQTCHTQRSRHRPYMGHHHGLRCASRPSTPIERLLGRSLLPHLRTTARHAQYQGLRRLRRTRRLDYPWSLTETKNRPGYFRHPEIPWSQVSRLRESNLDLRITRPTLTHPPRFTEVLHRWSDRMDHPDGTLLNGRELRRELRLPPRPPGEPNSRESPRSGVLYQTVNELNRLCL